MNISTKLAGIQLDNCLFNASGPLCTSAEQLHDLGKSQAGAIMSKSCTLEYRSGNPEPRYVDTPWGSINSMGLPNNGYQYYAGLASELKQHQKPYFISVSGLSLEENLAILESLNKSEGIHAIELNLSCPNVPGKPQTAYDFEQTKRVLDEVMCFDQHPIGVKLPPYFDIIHFYQMAEILNQYPIKFVTCINSIGNALVIDIETEQVVIKPKDGFGGIGGDYVKPTALANVRQFYTLLRKDIDVIGCGGVKNGQDAFEHILCGAKAVQVGTKLMQEGVDCFERISNELKAIMQAKGYEKLEDFRGKLKSME